MKSNNPTVSERSLIAKDLWEAYKDMSMPDGVSLQEWEAIRRGFLQAINKVDAFTSDDRPYNLFLAAKVLIESPPHEIQVHHFGVPAWNNLVSAVAAWEDA